MTITRLQLVGLMMMTICYTHYAVQWSITDVVMRFIQSLLYSVYLQPVCNSVIFELSNRIRSIIKLLTSAKSRPNETDNEPFHKKNRLEHCSSSYVYNARIRSAAKLARTRLLWQNKNIRRVKAEFAFIFYLQSFLNNRRSTFQPGSGTTETVSFMSEVWC